MESRYKRDLSLQYFRPLKSVHYSPWSHFPSPNKLELAEKLSRDYKIHIEKIFHLMKYVEIADSWALTSEIQLYYSDRQEVLKFEKDTEPIKTIKFECENKHLEITNPFVIDRIYSYLFKIYKDERHVQSDKKKRPSAKIVKLIATEIYNDLLPLIQSEKPRWKALCIVGYIFGLFNIGLKSNDYIMNQEQHEADRIKKRRKDIPTETYLQYLSSHMKRYINN